MLSDCCIEVGCSISDKEAKITSFRANWVIQHLRPKEDGFLTLANFLTEHKWCQGKKKITYSPSAQPHVRGFKEQNIGAVPWANLIWISGSNPGRRGKDSGNGKIKDPHIDNPCVKMY